MRSGLHFLDNDDVLAIKRVRIEDAVEDSDNLNLSEDARVLVLSTYDRQHRRHLDFATGVKHSCEAPDPDFPLKGARSLTLLFQYVVELGGSFDERQRKWASEQHLDKESAALHVHDMRGLSLHLALVYDHMDCSILASLEVIARMYQLTEDTEGTMQTEGAPTLHWQGRSRQPQERCGIGTGIGSVLNRAVGPPNRDPEAAP